MAIPFAMPEEENEMDTFLHQLHLHLVRLQVIVGQYAERHRSNHIATRVRNNNTSSSSSINSNLNQPNNNTTTNSSTTANGSFPEIVDNLAWLTSTSRDNASTQLTTTVSSISRIPRRRRTASESSWCGEEIKSSIHPVHHSPVWIQVGLILRQIADDFQNLNIDQDHETDDEIIPLESKTCTNDCSHSLLSRLVPDSFSSSLWTAVPVICVVGWHLLRAR